MPSRDLSTIHSIVKQMQQRDEIYRPTRAFVHAIDGERVDVYLPGSPGVIRHVEVIGNIEHVGVGESVALRWEHDRPQAIVVAPDGSDVNAFRRAIPVDGTSVIWGDKGLEIAPQGVDLGHLNFDPLLGGEEYNLSYSAEYKIPSESDNKFVWKDGRQGGQTIYGGTASGQNLTLWANAIDTLGRIYMKTWTQFDGNAEFTDQVWFNDDVKTRGAAGMEIEATASSAWGYLSWSDSDDAVLAYWRHKESTSIVEFAINGTRLFLIDSDGVTIQGTELTLSPLTTIGTSTPFLINGLDGYLQFTEISDSDEEPFPAQATKGTLYMKNDGLLYFSNDSEEFDLTSSGGGEAVYVIPFNSGYWTTAMDTNTRYFGLNGAVSGGPFTSNNGHPFLVTRSGTLTEVIVSWWLVTGGTQGTGESIICNLILNDTDSINIGNLQPNLAIAGGIPATVSNTLSQAVVAGDYIIFELDMPGSWATPPQYGSFGASLTIVDVP